MTVFQITGKANHQLRRIGLSMTGFAATVLINGLLIQSVDAYPYSKTDIVYTETNIPTKDGNSILAFERDNDGNLTPLPTSPYLTGGAGITGSAVVTDQNVIVNPNHTRLFAVNGGSNTIAVFDINQKDGSLSPVKGSPFPSGGVNPVSLGLAKDVLYVVNRNKDPQNPLEDASDSLPNYTAFRVTDEGKLIPIRKSTISGAKNSGPTQALISSDKRFLFGIDRGSGELRSFKIDKQERLRESPNSPQPVPTSEFPSNVSQKTGLGLQVHPKQPILYVGFLTINKLGVYSYNQQTGELTFLKTVPNSGKLICWIAINRAGTRLYTTNPGDNSVSVYDIAKDPTTPVEIQKVILNGSGGGANLTLDSTESYLQVLSQRLSTTTTEGNGVHVLKVNPEDGTVNEVATSPFQLPSIDSSVSLGIAAN